MKRLRTVVLQAMAIGLSLGLVHASAKQVPLHFGVGCAFSDYASLEPANGALTRGSSDTPSFRLLQDFGLGKGVFVLHFTQFHLPNDDYVLLRAKNVDKNSPDAKILAGSNTTGAFFSSPIVGEGFIVELYQRASKLPTSTSSGQTCLGFEVNGMLFSPQEQAEAAEESKLAIGLPRVDQQEAASSSPDAEKSDEDNESLCGGDESREAVCLENSSDPTEQAMYKASEPVARLVIRKDNNMNVAYCTGFLLGCEGHLVTNQHCIRNWLDALNTFIEFYAEARSCGSKSCETRGACPGRITAGNATLTAVSTDLDYALIKISASAGQDISSLFAQVGGYLQLRARGPTLQEEIYIPQYPLGQGKRIASTSSGRSGRIESLTAGECGGGGDAGYYVDTQEGSSGSPVIAKSDNAVVALHHCGGCLNGGIPSQKLIADLETKGVLPRCAIASS